MSKKEERTERFKALLAELEISQGTLAKYMYHEDTKTTRRYISRKHVGSVSTTLSDLTLLELLKRLKLDGYDLKSAVFSESGELVSIEPSSRFNERI